RVPATLEAPPDSHETAHLGGIQRIAQGGRPYFDALTQYGPGHQTVSYAMMHSTEFSVRGFRAAHFALNLVTIAAYFSIALIAFGWRLGACAILVALFISPLQVTSFVGWGVLSRWFAPFLVGALAPLV